MEKMYRLSKKVEKHCSTVFKYDSEKLFVLQLVPPVPSVPHCDTSSGWTGPVSADCAPHLPVYCRE